MTDGAAGVARGTMAFLEEEKRYTRMRDELNQRSRALPWVRVTERCAFETPGGTRTLTELFDCPNRLTVSRFVFSPES